MITKNSKNDYKTDCIKVLVFCTHTLYSGFRYRGSNNCQKKILSFFIMAYCVANVAITSIAESPQERYERDRNRTKHGYLMGRLFPRVLKYFRWNSHKSAVRVRMNERFTPLPPPPASQGIHNSFGKLFTVISHLK